MAETALGLLAVVACVAANAFFVAAEFALVTVRHTWVVELSRKGHPAAPHVQRAVDKLDDTIAATQLGITLASIALGWLGEPAFARLFDRPLAALGFGHHALAHSLSIAVAFALITFLHVVLGELAPKAVALGSPEALAIRTARPLLTFSRVFHPVIVLMNGAGNLVVRMLGMGPTGHSRVHSIGELKMLVEETQDAGSLDPISAEVAGRVLDLTEKSVEDAMVPRARVATLDLEMSEREIAERIWDAQYTRMPVWSRKKNRWIGVANVKMLLLRYARTGHLRLRDAIYVPITLTHGAPIARALRLFRRRKQHLAFVVADDGAQIGIVTLEDVLEQMVGAIDDELDLAAGERDTRMSRASLEKAERPSMG